MLGNNGVLNPEAAEKAAHFVQLNNQIDVPLVFFQNLTGFVVGRDFGAVRHHQEGLADDQRGHQLGRCRT